MKIERVALIVLIALFCIQCEVKSAFAYDINSEGIILDSIKFGHFKIIELEYANDENPKSVYISFEGPIRQSLILESENITIMPHERIVIPIRIKGNMPEGKYEGFIILRNGIDKRIPIMVQIFDKDFIAARAMKIDTKILDQKLKPGQEMVINIFIENQLTYLNYSVQLEYSIFEDGNISKKIYSDIEVFNLSDKRAITKIVELPDNISIGEHKFVLKTSYMETESLSEVMFYTQEHFWNIKLFWMVRVWMAILFLVFVFLIIGTIKFIKYQKKKKKKFLVEIDYDTLPQGSERDIKIGKITETNINAFLDMDKLSVHTIVAGSTGSGKSICAQDIVEECLLKNVAVVAFDPTAQWTGMLKKCEDENFLKLYPQFGMRPNDAQAFRGNIRIVKHARQNIDALKYAKPGEIHIFAAHKLDPEDYDKFVAITIRNIFKRKNTETRELKFLLVFDEIHRILPKFGGSGEGFLQIERGAREFRKWGIGLLLISQVLQDFIGEVKANINTQVQMKTRDENDLGTINTNYGEDYVHKLVKAPVGSGVVQNSAWNKGIPYFVSFRPIMHSVERVTDEKIVEYDEFNIKIENMDDQLGELENLGQDTADMKIELNLVKEKMTTGNLKVVKVYLEELEPRFESVWKKMGMEPPKQGDVELVDDKSLQEELEKAKTARENFVKEDVKTSISTKTQTSNIELEEANWNSINDLEKQLISEMQRGNKDQAMQLFDEVKKLQVPKEKSADKQKIIKDIEKMIKDGT